ncbi:FAD-binding domain-containing protein [Exidia glandulosa HHB12029]|uniref:FAD-binding domain-containing protein n=1 Tax=Exidia glandulosa HHB12029 TaxID=1314781 RepID=A0A165NLY3_EXIGL|nr:FAD-binding domain-containing protein [Exidia glandulosa HHB12029]
MLSIVSFSILISSALAAAPYCLPGNSCFPSTKDLSVFNATVGGRLIKSVPYGSVCYAATYDAEKCAALVANMSNGEYRLEIPDALMYSNWEVTEDGTGCPVPRNVSLTPVQGTCTYGNLAPYIVDATVAQDIVNSVKFAAKYNLRLRVKSTGHDYAGRSSGEGSFTIRTHKLQGTSYIPAFVPSGCSATAEPALLAEAGVNVRGLYTAADKFNRTTIAGVTPTVGALGGYILGAGTGAFSHQKGLGVDNVLQFEVVTTDGTLRIANRCQNSDLFWALRGGGGAFGVTTRAWLKSYAPLKATNSLYGGLIANDTQTWESLIRTFVDLLPALYEKGITGEWSASYPQLGLILQRHFEANETLVSAADSLSALNAAISIPGVYNALNAGQYSTWLEAYEKTIVPTTEDGAAVGINVLLASRIASDALIQSAEGRRKVADYIIAYPKGASIIFQMLVGGAVNVPSTTDTAVNPAWRSSFGFVDIVVGGSTPEVTDAQAALMADMRTRSDAVFGTAVYYNENAPTDNWQEVQWGSNYARLLSIKKKYDPKGVLTCRACVGSEIFGY